jgi:hypothetical protein
MYDFCKNIEWLMSFYELLQSIEFGVLETFCELCNGQNFGCLRILVCLGYGELETCEIFWQLQFVWLQDLLLCNYW